jgi:hypothetical protein
LSVGFEFEPLQEETHAYPKLSKQWMEMSVTNTLVKERTEIIVDNADEGLYALTIVNPLNSVTVLIKDIPA